MNLREAIVEYAKTFLGTPYKTLDCSDLTEKVYMKFGVPFKYMTAASQAKYLYDRGLTTKVPESAKGDEIEAYLEVGDQIFWENKNDKTRFMDIHHTAIYIGNGDIIESRGTGVQICDHFWESVPWQIILVGRPIELMKDYEESEEEEVMKKGDSGETVYMLQRAMLAAGYTMLKAGKMWLDLQTGENNGCDGVFGDWTELVITEIQEKHGLNKTGVVDYLTYGFIASDIEPEDDEYVQGLEDTISNDKLVLTDIAEQAANRIGKKLV